MNRLFGFLAAAVLVTLLGGMAAAAGAYEIRVATQPIPHYAPIFVAKQKKWVEEELAKVGAKPAVKWTSFAAGPPINESSRRGSRISAFSATRPPSLVRPPESIPDRRPYLHRPQVPCGHRAVCFEDQIAEGSEREKGGGGQGVLCPSPARPGPAKGGALSQ